MNTAPQLKIAREPNDRPDYYAMSQELVSGSSRSVVVGRENDLDEHFENLKSEFVGLPVLCFHVAKTIVLIRRKLELEQNVDEFFSMIDSNLGLLCKHLSTRWLVAICDTIADHGSTIQKAASLSVIVLVNTAKLSETERILEGRNVASKSNDTASEFLNSWPHELWDGVTSYHLLRGDMPRNMFARVERTLVHTPRVAKIFATIKLRLEAGENLFSRMAKHNQSGFRTCLLYTSPSPRDLSTSRMPSSA